MSPVWRGSRPRPLYKSLFDGLVFVVFLLIVVVVLRWAGLLQPETGIFAAIDGDSLRKGNSEIRLYGIDAPELHQTCFDSGHFEYPCGREAHRALADLVAGYDLKCFTRDTDRYGRAVAQCNAGKMDINAEMVRQGWAIAYRRHSSDYVAEEAYAEKDRRGIWQGDFETPEKWRADHRIDVTRGDMGD